MQGLKYVAARGVAWNLAQNVAGKLLGLVVFAVLARLLDRSAFGAVAVALAVTALAELLVTQGYGEFITQSPELSDSHLDTAFWLNVGLGLLLTLIIAVAAGPLSAAFGEQSVAPIVRVLSASLVIRSLTIVPSGLLTRELRFRELSFRTVVAALVSGVSGITAAVGGLGIYSLVIQILVGDVVAAAMLWRATSWRPGLRVSRSSLKELSAFGAPIFGAGLLGFFSRRLDSLVILGSLGLNTLGVYAAAQRLSQIANQILNKSSEGVAFSALARLSEDSERRRQGFYRVVEVTVALCFPAYAGLALVSEPLMQTVFGMRWGDGAPILAMFALSGIPVTLSYIHFAAYKSAGRTRFVLLNHIVMVTLYLPLLFVLVRWGASAAAAAYLIAACLIIPVELVGVRASLGIRFTGVVKALSGPTMATALMAALTWGAVELTTSIVPSLRLVILGLTGAGCYVLALKLLAPLTFARCLDLARGTITRRNPDPAL